VKEWCNLVHHELRDRGSFAPTLRFVFQIFHKTTRQMAPRGRRYSDSTKQRRVNLLVGVCTPPSALQLWYWYVIGESYRIARLTLSDTVTHQ